jgi:hypothetical protein
VTVRAVNLRVGATAPLEQTVCFRVPFGACKQPYDGPIGLSRDVLSPTAAGLRGARRPRSPRVEPRAAPRRRLPHVILDASKRQEVADRSATNGKAFLA